MSQHPQASLLSLCGISLAAALLGAAAAPATPLAFEPNRGQTGNAAAYLARTSDGILFVTPEEIVLRLAEPPAERLAEPPAGTEPAATAEQDLRAGGARFSGGRQHVLRIQPVGASAARLESSQRLESRSSYYRAGGDTIADVPHFGRVTYRGLYPLTDLVVRGEDGRWAYDFVLAPEADPRLIALRFEGAGAPRIEADGSLALDTPIGTVHQSAPFLYQEVGGERVQVAGGFELRQDGLVGFAVGSYDRGRQLVIDPTFTYKTCVGGLTAYSTAEGVEVSSNGQAYVVGTTYALDFPTPGGFQTTLGTGSDAFVAKLDLAGNLSRATYFDLGGSERGEDIDLDASNNVFISGSTADAGFVEQAFVAKLSPLLDVVNWTRIFGGTSSDGATGVVVDGSGNVFAGGYTTSGNFCTTGLTAGKCTVKTTLGGATDAFLIKLGPNGGVLWATLAGTNNFDRGTAVAVDDSGRPYLGGYSETTLSPVVYSSWVKRFAAAGTSVLYSFSFGTLGTPGSTFDYTAVWDLAVDPQNNAYVTGGTTTTQLEVAGAVQPALGGGADAFVGMINSSGTGFVYNTYLGGPATEIGSGIRVYNGHAYIAGRRHDTDPDGDAFVARYSSGGLGLVFYTAFGGSLSDYATALAQDASRNLYAAGWTQSNDFDPGDPACALAAWSYEQIFVTKVAP